LDFFSFLFERISTKVEDTQSVNTVKSAEEGIFVKRLRSLFPAIEIKVEHVSFFRFLCNLFFLNILQGRISVGHDTLPYGLSMRFNTMTSTFTSESPSKNAAQFDLMTLIYSLTYRNLRIQLYPIESYKGEEKEM